METSQMGYGYFASPPVGVQPFVFGEENMDPLEQPYPRLPYDTTFNPFSASLIATANNVDPAATTTGAHSPPTISTSPDLDLDLAAMVGSGDASLLGEVAGSGSGSRTTRGSSEEKLEDQASLTPAQSRRKAQNRAAQRAFRERKERHVKDLEARLTAAESSATTLQSDNARLRHALQRARAENDILRATSSHLPSGGVGDDSAGEHSPTSPLSAGSRAILDDDDGKQESVRRDSSLTLLPPPSSSNPLSTPSTNIPAPSLSPSTSSSHAIRSKHPVTAAGAWDLLQAHPLVSAGLVDISDVVERLRGAARGEGAEAVFEVGEVRRAVEGCRRGGGEELI